MLLGRYKAGRAQGGKPTIALLDREFMRDYGRYIALLEPAGEDEFLFLFTGTDVPNDDGRSAASRTTAGITPASAQLFRLGCREALARRTAICISHQTGRDSRVHRWECLFLPLEDGEERTMVAAFCIPRQDKHEVYRAIIDAMPHAMLVVAPLHDEQGEIIDAAIVMSNSAAKMLAEAGAEGPPAGSTLRHVIAAGLPLGSWERHHDALRNGKEQIFDFHHRTDEEARWFQIHASPLSDGLLISIIDITRLKRACLEIEHQRKILVEEVEQRRNLEKELWALAHLDPLTGLPNRRAFGEQAVIRLAAAQTVHQPCAAVTIDIDHFKRVNDAYGHSAGDAVLRHVAGLIKAPLRPESDLVARMGGEEFVILLPGTGAEAAMAFAERLRRQVEEAPLTFEGQEIRTTISLGIALNRKSSNLEDLIHRADRALYTAKRSGRNKVATELDAGSATPEFTEAA